MSGFEEWWQMPEEWAPGRWWRVTISVKGVRKLWCETSDEAEARHHLSKIPYDATEPRLERLWERRQTEWRGADNLALDRP